MAADAMAPKYFARLSAAVVSTESGEWVFVLHE